MGVSVLIVEDDQGMRTMLSTLFRRHMLEVSLASGVREAHKALTRDHHFDVVVSDLSMPDGTGLDVLEHAKQLPFPPEVILITAFATMEQAVAAMRLGAYDYIQKPFKNAEILALIDKASEKKQLLEQNRVLRREVVTLNRDAGLIGASQAMKKVMEVVSRVADAPSSVLITGESGTGKELVARAIHLHSQRRSKPFVVVNCGALPENLMESELFGHEKGAFTGASTRQDGLVRSAHGGTLFLDEIGELPLSLQVKLLRVLQERKVRPVGSATEIEVDVRFVAATNRQLEDEISAGRFREDLYYRLNVIRLALPPLRDRREDIPLLAEHFVAKHAAIQGKSLRLSSDATRTLVGEPLKGNVRELENLIERAVAYANQSVLDTKDLLFDSNTITHKHGLLGRVTLTEEGLDLDALLSEIERDVLLQSLERSRGSRSGAAKLLGMTFRSMRYRLAKYGLGDASEEDSADSLME